MRTSSCGVRMRKGRAQLSSTAPMGVVGCDISPAQYAHAIACGAGRQGLGARWHDERLGPGGAHPPARQRGRPRALAAGAGLHPERPLQRLSLALCAHVRGAGHHQRRDGLPPVVAGEVVGRASPCCLPLGLPSNSPKLRGSIQAQQGSPVERACERGPFRLVLRRATVWATQWQVPALVTAAWWA